MKIKITVDSTADLPISLASKYDIEIMPLVIHLGEKSFKDGYILSSQIYDFVNKTGQLPKTSAPSIIDYKSMFEKYIGNGYEVIHFNISSDLSCSYQNAVIAAQGLSGVHIIDSRTLSTGISLLAIFAAELAKQGELTAQEIYDKVIARIPSVQASFVIDTLTYLHKGGRCSSLTMFGANLLKLKPSIHVENGKLVVSKKYRGTLSKVVNEYVDEILATYTSPDLTRVFITHASAPDEAVEAVKNILMQNTKFKEIIINIAGATVTSHCGKNTLGILFINDKAK